MPNPKDDLNFSNNQVMALVESFKNDIKVIAEDLTSLKEDVSGLKNDMTEVKADLTTIKDALRITIPTINSRLDKLEAKIGI